MPSTSSQPPAAGEAAHTLANTARYLVIPTMPRDVWYGVPAAPESYQLVAFVEQRHSHINPMFDAQYLADALNAKASHAALVEALEAVVAARIYRPLGDTPQAVTLRNMLDKVEAALQLAKDGQP